MKIRSLVADKLLKQCRLCITLIFVTAQPNLNLTQLKVGVTLKLVSKCPHRTHPPTKNFSTTSSQPRATQFSIQAQLTPLIHIRQEKNSLT